MTGFIEIVDKNNLRRLLNIKHIEEVAENITKDGCYIYMAFNTPNSYEQDHYEVTESYEKIIEKLCKAVVVNAYAIVN